MSQSDTSRLQGRRLADVTMGAPPEKWEPWKRREPGDYMKVSSADGTVRWWLCDPLGRVGQIGAQFFSITEHDDGTITVKPSIAAPPPGWHGHLEHGVWRLPADPPGREECTEPHVG